MRLALSGLSLRQAGDFTFIVNVGLICGRRSGRFGRAGAGPRAKLLRTSIEPLRSSRAASGVNNAHASLQSSRRISERD